MYGHWGRMASKAPMILEIGNRRGRSGFTLVEIILVLGLIALATSVVLVNFAAFADRGDASDPKTVLREAIRDARFLAAREGVAAQLRFDPENGQLILQPGGQTYSLDPSFAGTGRSALRFFLVPPGEGLGRLPEPGRSRLETAAIHFAPDRSSSPFFVEIDTGAGRPERLYFDPFSDIVQQAP